MDDEKIRLLMHALTVFSRPQSREKWMKRGFRKLRARNPDALFCYWKRRLEGSVKDHALFWKVWGEHQARVAEKAQVPTHVPPLLTQAKTLAEAAVRFVAGGMRFVTDEQFNDRLAECTSCEMWDSKAFNYTGRCLKCGCSTQGKLRLPAESCPLKKWLPVVPVES